MHTFKLAPCSYSLIVNLMHKILIPLSKEMPVDRLSELPGCLISHILSFLEVKQSAITVVLSKRWRFLWRDSTRLIFTEESSCPVAIQDFVTRVNRTLLVVCGGLETFEVEFPYYNSYSVDVNVWVDFALKNKVKEISLLLIPSFSSSSIQDLYTLPQMLFHNSNLKQLTLQSCVVAPRTTIEWRSLTELDIKGTKLQQHVIDKLLSGCPVLYRLILESCSGFNRLEVDSKSLYELRVSDPGDRVDEPLLLISAPYLHTLSVNLYPDGRKLCLENISSLVRATIDFNGYDWYLDSEEVTNNAKELLGNIRHVKVVETEGGYNEVLSSLAVTGYQFPQSARTSLLVEAPIKKLSIHGIIGLLESSPNLEALVIEGFTFHEEPTICPDVKDDLDCELLHLKTITIKYFIDPNLDGEPMLTLARMLLKKAPTLEKMVVRTGLVVTTFSPIPMIKLKLLSYPRSSKEAVILLR